jgi:predicted ribosome quality control (RQC) complex YloA/Tae2 family protein
VSLTREELELTVTEAGTALTGGRIDRVLDLGDLKVALEVHSGPEPFYLLLSARPGFSRAHLLSCRPGPAVTPGAFVMLLRKHLHGGRVASLGLWGADRVVRLEVTQRGCPSALLAELTGRHANLFLLGDGERILGSLRANVSHRRDLWSGQPYVYPIPREQTPPAPRFGPEAPGRAAEALCDRLERDDRVRALTLDLSRALREGRRRVLRRRDAILGDRGRAESAEEDRRIGEILVANLGLVRRGATSARVVDYGVDPPAEVEIPLDPAMTPRANADRYFHRYRKYRDAQRTIEERLLRAERDLAALDQWEERLAAAGEDEGALRGLREGLVARGLARAKASSGAAARVRAETLPSEPFRRFVSREGRPILVGKGAGQNDELSFRVARGNDLWMHARDYPGAHVVVPMGKDEEPTQETLLDAATLAAHYSQAKGAAVVDIAYTRRKWVHRVKGAPPGKVALNESRTLALRVDPARLVRLMRKRDLD